MQQQQDGAMPLAPDDRSGDGRDVTTILDADATIRYVSPSIEPILGYKPEQLVGQNWFQYVHPDDAAQALPGFGQATPQAGAVRRNAVRVRHANGSWVRVEEVGSNLLHYPGVHGWILNARNTPANGNAGAVPVAQITKGDDKLAALTLRCESLEHSNRWQTELVAILSHELRTPLNVIIGYHDLLLDGTFGALSPEQAYTLKRAHRSARELSDIINATLDLCRLDAGRIRLVTQTIAANDLIDEVTREMRDACDKPGLAIRWNLEPELPKIVTDPSKLKLVLKHLVRNALQVSDHGQITVTARSGAHALEIDVADTGTQISGDAIRAIFGSKDQPDSTAWERFGGSSLGLYLVRRLVELLGGSIAVEAAPETGSIFHISLPVDRRTPRAASTAK